MTSSNVKTEGLKETLKVILPQCYILEEGFELNLLKYSENITFLILEPVSGRKRVFRVNRQDYHDFCELNGEIAWMREISRDTDLVLPEVYEGKNGKYIQKFQHEEEQHTGILISFLEGKMVEEMSGNTLSNQMVEIGKILAELHIQSIDRDKRNEIKRSSWNIEDIFGKDAKWGSWRNFEKLSKDQEVVLEKAEKIIIKRLENYGMSPERYGLIHADMHCSNIIVRDGVSQIFDFDDCGYGWYLYDFGCSLIEYSYTKDLLGYMLEGYETLRKLSDEDKNELEMFVLLRKIVRLAWISGHSDSDTVKGISEDYFSEIFKMAEEFVSENQKESMW